MVNTEQGMVMPVAPMYGGGYSGGMGGFGGDWGWIILLLLIGWGGNGFGVGMGGFSGGLGIDFPWLLNGQNGINNNVNDGFRDAQLHDSVTSVRDGVSALATQLCGCCGDMQMALANSTAGIQQSLCNGFAGTTAAVTGAQNAISQQLNANEIANLNRSFAEQTANMQGFNGINAGIADTRYTIATEACATRTADANNARDIIDAVNNKGQMLMDKLCALELDGYKNQLAQAQRENVGLQNQLNMATMAASQTAQTAQITDNIYNRLASCPVGTVPVYGESPIFNCNGNTGCGCGGNF